MYRGELAEVGDVDLVVKQPRHPYTQLLIQSIPKADPSHPWVGHELLTNGAVRGAVAAEHCQFVDRCPYAMDVCRQEDPPLFRTDELRAAACFLYKESPVLEGAELEEVLATRAPAER
jgi:peptide/nickel transport system ATP-binding protein